MFYVHTAQPYQDLQIGYQITFPVHRWVIILLIHDREGDLRADRMADRAFTPILNTNWTFDASNTIRPVSSFPQQGSFF